MPSAGQWVFPGCVVKKQCGCCETVEASFGNLSAVENWGSLDSALMLPSSVSWEKRAGCIWAPPGRRACDPQPQRCFPGFIAIVCLSSVERLGPTFLIDICIFHLCFHIRIYSFSRGCDFQRVWRPRKADVREDVLTEWDQERGVHSLKQWDRFPLGSRQKEGKNQAQIKTILSIPLCIS